MHAIVIHLHTHGHSYPDDREPCKNGRDKWIDGDMKYSCNICNFDSTSRHFFCDHIAFGWTLHTIGMAHRAMVPPQDAMDDSDDELLDLMVNGFEEANNQQ